MGDLVDIRRHPDFRRKTEEDVDGVSSELLEALQEARPGDVLTAQKHPDQPTGPVEVYYLPISNKTKEETTGLANCSLCKHRVDIRRWWPKFLGREPELEDLLCGASPRQEVVSPITGQKGFLAHGARIPHDLDGNTYFQEEPLDWCFEINLLGTCPRFEPTITYGGKSP